MSELMKDIPQPPMDKEAVRKQIQELMELKEQVTLKRRQLKALGVKEDPELSSMMIKYPDSKAAYQKKKALKAAGESVESKPSVSKPIPIVPADSPFVDPNAKPAPVESKPAPVESKPTPVESKPTPAPTPMVSKPVDIPTSAPVHKRVQSNVVSTPLRVAHDGRWLF